MPVTPLMGASTPNEADGGNEDCGEVRGESPRSCRVIAETFSIRSSQRDNHWHKIFSSHFFTERALEQASTVRHLKGICNRVDVHLEIFISRQLPLVELPLVPKPGPMPCVAVQRSGSVTPYARIPLCYVHMHRLHVQDSNQDSSRGRRPVKRLLRTESAPLTCIRWRGAASGGVTDP